MSEHTHAWCLRCQDAEAEIARLRAERDALRRRVEELKELLVKIKNGPRPGGEWWVKEVEAALRICSGSSSGYSESWSIVGCLWN